MYIFPYFCYMIYLAPMQGYTEYVFRNTYARYFTGIDMAISPFISLVKGESVKITHLKDVWPENNPLMKVIPQVLGNNPVYFIAMAKALYDMGYEEINWNLGCPVKGVARKKRGSGILPYPHLIESILDTVIPKIPNKISIKTRLGYKKTDEFFELIPIFNKYPLSALFIHPRIGLQLYTGNSHLRFLKKVLPKLNQAVIFSGDINTLKNYRDIREQFPQISDIMLGRGLIANPFLPASILGKKISSEKKKEIFFDFNKELLASLQEEMIAEKHVLNKMKEYWLSFQHLFQNGSDFFNQLKLAGNLRYMKELFNNYCDQSAIKYASE